MCTDVHGGQHGERRSEEAGDYTGHLSVDATAADGHGRMGKIHPSFLPTESWRPGFTPEF